MLVNVKNLSLHIETKRGTLQPVRSVSFSVKEGEIVGVVGESGSGKTLCHLALMGLLPRHTKATSEALSFKGRNLAELTEWEWQKIRGKEMAMIFQDPLSALNPCMAIGHQIAEVMATHRPEFTKKERREQAVELLKQVGLPDPHKRVNCYPHELSGGMCQRVMIAQAVACRPQLLIADEPTTALDVTIQSQILDLLLSLQEKHKMAIVFITHDIAVVASMAHRLHVMYAGEIVEKGDTDKIIQSPLHPYTQGLFQNHPAQRKTW